MLYLRGVNGLTSEQEAAIEAALAELGLRVGDLGGRPSWSPSQIPIPIPSLFAAPGGEGGSRQDPPPLRAVSPRWCGSPHALVYLKYGVTPPL